MRYPLLLLTGLLAAACSNRERTNPLDPNNPVTNGAPTGFQAAANRNIVTLTWDRVEVQGLTGYHIYRCIGGDSLAFYEPVSSPERTFFQDANLNYDSTYVYAVQAITEWGESRRSPPDTLIPGRYNFWIADFSGSSVRRISYDGAHVLGREYFNSPVAVAYHPGEGKVWVADYYDRAVYYMNVDFTGIKRIALTGRPIDLVPDTDAGGVFIMQIAPDAIYHASPAGTTLTTNKIPVKLDLDASFTLDVQSSFLWLSTPTGFSDGIVYRLGPPAPGGRWELVASIPYPNQVAADPVAGGCWIATDSGVVRIDPAGYRTTYLPQLKVRNISLNPANGDCYYVGRSHQDWQWETGRLYGQPDPQIILGADYSDLTGIQVLPGEGQAGFLIGQRVTGRILRFTRDGDLMGRLEGFYKLLDFSLE